jgi:DME family drug/metabolite transporter
VRSWSAVLLAALCFATTGTAQALADVDASPLAVGLARVALGGGLLALWALRAPRGPADRRTTGALARVPTGGLVGVGAAGVLAYQPAFFAGTSANGVAVGTVVALGTAPVATGLADALLRRRRPGARWVGSTGLALVGLVLVSGVVDAGAGLGGAGVLWSVAAGAAYAVYAVAGKELLDRGWSSGRVMGSMFGVAAAVAAPVLALSGPDWLLGTRGPLLVVWLGVVTTAVAYLLFGWGLARLPATTVATLTLAEPLCATVLGVVVLHERLDTVASLGLVVIAGALVVLTAPAREPRAVRA